MSNCSISHNFFNEKFKDYLRNLYVYGYIPESEFPGSARTFRYDTSRIEQIGYIPMAGDGSGPRWRLDRKNRSTYLVTQDSRELYRNPVHIFYRMCDARETDALFFLTVLLQAAAKRAAAEDLLIDEIMDVTDPAWRQQWEKFLRSEDARERKRVRDDPEANARRSEYAQERKQFRDSTQANVRKRMQQEFGSTGLLRFTQSGNSLAWSLPDITLQNLLDSITEEERQGFLSAVDFFMKLGPFGEIGDFFLSRLEPERRRNVEKGSVRMDQLYLPKALNDYNSVDLLQAVHTGAWVIITYFNPQVGMDGYVFCKPVKLRSSTVSGREYVGYYDPVRRRAAYLRMEYVQSVELLNDRYIPWLLAAVRQEPCLVRLAGQREPRLCRPAVFATDADGAVQLAKYTGAGTRAQAVLLHRTDCGTEELPALKIVESRLQDDSGVQADLDRAETVLDETWGVSVPYTDPQQTLTDLKLYDLTMILYVWQGEDFIRTRLWQEARRGLCDDLDAHRIRFRIRVLDPWEMVPWITSFAGRILQITCTAPGFECYMRHNLRQLYQTCTGGSPEGLPPLQEQPANRPSYSIPNLRRDSKNETYQGQLRNPSPLCRREPAAHLLLFSPLYSGVYQNCFTAYDKIAGQMARPGGWAAAEKAASLVPVLSQSSLDRLTDGRRPGSVARFEQMLPKIGSVCRTSRTLGSVTPLMQKLVPLTELERRWLLAILHEPLAGYFLEQRTVDRLSVALKASGVSSPLYRRMEIELFDQYRHQAHAQPGGRRHFHLLRTAIRAGRRVKVAYLGARQTQPTEWELLPLRMDYAIRDDVFRVVCQPVLANGEPDGDRVTLRLDRIMDVRLLSGVFRQPDGARDDTVPYTLVFSGEKNLPDRILTQFAPRCKRCERGADGTYRLTFYAEEQEWKDVLIQVLSFGYRVRLEQPERAVEEMRRRLTRQKNMWM